MFMSHCRTVMREALRGMMSFNEYTAPLIAKEIDNLKKGTAPIQHLTKAIIAREECIIDLH